MKNDNTSGNAKITTTHNNRVNLLDARQKHSLQKQKQKISFRKLIWLRKPI